MSNALDLLHTMAGPGLFFDWGPFAIQIGNLVVIVIMIVLFVLALFVPFPAEKRRK